MYTSLSVLVLNALVAFSVYVSSDLFISEQRTIQPPLVAAAAMNRALEMYPSDSRAITEEASVIRLADQSYNVQKFTRLLTDATRDGLRHILITDIDYLYSVRTSCLNMGAYDCFMFENYHVEMKYFNNESNNQPVI